MQRIIPVVLSIFLAARVNAAFDPLRATSAYETLQRWQYTTQEVAVAQPLEIQCDTAKWTLTSGTVHLMQPVEGRVTGLVFEGKGQFTMTVPDRVELTQLRRFTGQPQLQRFDQAFTQLVFRTSEDTIERSFPGTSKAPFAANAIAAKRQNHWLIDLRTDIDARIIAAMSNRGAKQILATMKTADFDWVSFDYDSSREEEMQLIRWPHTLPEIWLSLDRAEDRATDGRPGKRSSRMAALSFIDVTADLTRHRVATAGETQQQMIGGHYNIAEEITVSVDGIGALVMQIDPTAQNMTVKDDAGHPLTLLRDHIGARAASLENKIWDSALTVVLTKPAKSGDDLRLTFEYDLETSNYAPGNRWYPTVPDAFDNHTARLELTSAKNNAVKAMGRLDKQTDFGSTTKSIWIVDKPTKMVTFATAERFGEETVSVAGIPKVVAFGWTPGTDVKTRLHNSAADVANSLQYFQSLLGDPIGGDTFYVATITADHGQAFDGFLHLSESAYSEHPGATELFRAHEVAHEWFGHRVGWKTYRDQWLSESLAEYAAMMFVQSTVKDGTKYFDEIIHAYNSTVKGSLAAAFSKFTRPWLVELRGAQRARVGPIGFGYRASAADVPTGYYIQTYVKGPLVINMLREILRIRTHNDETFVKILRDYVHEYGGKLATTADFESIVERDAQTDFRWFFDEWIYGAEIPTIKWNYQVAQSGAGYKLNLTAKKSDVSPDFVVIAPIRLDFDGGKTASTFIVVKGEEETISKDLPLKPRDVVLGPEGWLLANVRRE